MIKIKIKKLHADAQLPTKNKGDAGYDVYAIEDVEIPPYNRRIVKIGIAMSVPEGYYGHISDRSGIAWNKGGHCLGKIVDPIYRGGVGVILFNSDPLQTIFIKKGDRAAQIIFKKYEDAEFEETDNLDESLRGENGFGSSGN